MFHWEGLLVALFFNALTHALRYDPEQVGFNLNENKAATDPLDYSGEWTDHTFFPSPSNWRMPMYTLFLDRFVNGDPSNDNANGTQFEHDLLSTQLRNGGDLKGLQDTLDYLQGMGVRTLYIAGSPMINEPWGSDGYSPLDLTLLDRHHGDISAWRDTIAEIHRRNMYVVLDNTFATMGDLMGFEGYLNTSTPFAAGEHNAVWKSERRYHDFEQSNVELDHCKYPRFWGDEGNEVHNLSHLLVGCRDSEFDQYGEVASFGNYPEWQRQLSKFAFVQDRLREWRPSVLAKIQHFSCMTIASLDIDGFRIDKALQVTVDAQGAWSSYIRQCAMRYNKTNFYIPGEIVAGNSFGAVYIGRGMEPKMQRSNVTDIVASNNASAEYIRDVGESALDAAAFHYTVYRALTRFLGMSGSFEAEGDPPVNFVETWTAFLQTNDMSNAYTGEFDPRHMFGISNQDVFRWPAIKNGTEKNLLGLFIITLLFPGIPTLTWGEEQAFYVLDSTAANYVFGRPPMSSSLAWQIHGCYKVGSVKYANFPLESAAYGCEDDNISLDHRDPSHPVRNIIKRMFEMREIYPTLNDGYYLQQLSNQTYDLYLPGSDDTPTETGLWSVLRSSWAGVQNLSSNGDDDQGVWLLFTNENRTVNHQFNCSDNSSLAAPFAQGTTVRNLFPPYEEYTLVPGYTEQYGCLPSLSMPAWGYKALVPTEQFMKPRPVLTAFSPGHDYRLWSDGEDNGIEAQVKFAFSQEMDCDSISENIRIVSTISSSDSAKVNLDSAKCSGHVSTARWVGEPATAFIYEVKLYDVHHGIHQITIDNVSSTDGAYTNAVDSFLIRVGDFDNPLVYPKTANYSTSVLSSDSDGKLYVSHKAAGADLWRYSLNFGTTFSDWETYTGEQSALAPREWSGTSKQAWEGEHVILQYWAQLAGSSSHYQHSDLNWTAPRRFPNLWIEGPFNQYGYDAGLRNQMQLGSNASWNIDFMDEWPAQVSINAWGINPDGQPDVTQTFGDIDGDNVLDRIPPLSLLTNMINITKPPPSPSLGYRIQLHDGQLRYELIPVGSMWAQLVLYCLLALIPLLTAIGATWTYVGSFYQVKFNKYGVSKNPTSFSAIFRRKLGQFQVIEDGESTGGFMQKVKNTARELVPKRASARVSEMSVAPTLRMDMSVPSTPNTLAFAGATVEPVPVDVNEDRRTVLIATMEYDIEDWEIKIKIGGLGVMSQLMGKHLGHQNLIWVVPCVGGIDYPAPEDDEIADPMEITILGNTYQVQTQTHTLRNIMYVLLDAPVFRRQTKAEPYPPRMDDMESAIYYSAWNSCIAEAIKRYKPDLYHINDYHGTIAPLHLLPQTIPCALSLHNAEFQGLWPMRTREERNEVCKIYNLDPEIVQEYVQFGEVFNLLHAGASYLRVHQNGFGAVGVSTKYGKRSYARYPIFWGLSNIGGLPNPDPSDLAAWSRGEALGATGEVTVDADFEAKRGSLREEAQKWANLNVDASAELFVFVGRWSMQKGIDLIADVFPTILEKHPKTQLICVGPVIDLYGKFAAIKLAKMMEKYPGRVYSNPKFTALPSYIFSGAEYALIPSRDEPFGLVAVEFGRKGALGVGARVGGLGQMPGWWYTIESISTQHLLQQFKGAIEGALSSQKNVRAILRARSGHQRFPVQQWVQDLGILQSRSIKAHQRYAKKNRYSYRSVASRNSAADTRSGDFGRGRRLISHFRTPTSSRPTSRHNVKSRIQRTDGGEGTVTPPMPSMPASPVTPSLPATPKFSANPTMSATPTVPAISGDANTSPAQDMGTRMGPGHLPSTELDEADEESVAGDLEYYWDGDEVIGRAMGDDEDRHYWESHMSTLWDSPDGMELQNRLRFDRFDRFDHSRPPTPELPPLPTVERSHVAQTGITSPTGCASPPLSPPPIAYDPMAPLDSSNTYTAQLAMLSNDAVVGEKKDFNLQRVDPFFTDPEQDYETAFSRQLEDLSGKTTYNTVIEEFIEKSEKDWFNRLRGAKMGKTKTPVGSIFQDKTSHTPTVSVFGDADRLGDDDSHMRRQFLLADDYKPPTGMRKLLLHRLGDWPVYSLLLAFAQVISANSYQITLLTGEVGESASKLYTISSIYLITSILWWTVYRTLKSFWALSLPFVFFGLAFFFTGVAPQVSGADGKKWIQNVAAACYATASSSGSLFFALNFGDQGGAPVRSWVFRASVIQGTQQIYISFLWCWGAALAKMSESATSDTSLIATNPTLITSLGMVVAVLMWAVGCMLFFGLPDYYRQSPGKVPSFLAGIFRRKIVLWFFAMVVIQNFFLSAPYGRNWLYLWSSQHLPTWGVGLLVLLFFIVIWAVILYFAAVLSKSHSWLMPIFAIGLGAPRWCQMLWGVSGVGLYVPWAGGPIGSAIAGRSLWLWLGVLDSLQNVGFGMIMLHTLTRFHISFVLIVAQVLGSIATMAARGFAPDNLGPGPVFPNLGIDIVGGLQNAWFWIALFAQLAINFVGIKFFRKEQLSKP